MFRLKYILFIIKLSFIFFYFCKSMKIFILYKNLDIFTLLILLWKPPYNMVFSADSSQLLYISKLFVCFSYDKISLKSVKDSH